MAIGFIIKAPGQWAMQTEISDFFFPSNSEDADLKTKTKNVMKLHHFDRCQSIDELKSMFRNLCKLHHPDRGGDVKTMQEVNAEYAYICQNLSRFFVCENEEQTVKDLTIFASIIEKVEMLPVEIEVIGSWLWISGNTYPHRQILKDAGLMFAPRKKVWYYRPEEFKSSNYQPLEMDEIRHKYGSTKIENKFKPQLN